MADGNPVWKADHVRITLFSDALWGADPASVVKALLGHDAEETTSKPALSEHAASAFLDALRRIEVRFALNRLDCIVQPRLDVVPNSVPPVLSSVEAELRELADKIAPWAAMQGQSINRIAIAGGALRETKDVPESYAILAELLPVIKLQGHRHRDFRLQLNTPQESAVIPGLELNVLCTWSALNVSGIFFDAAANSGQASFGGASKNYVQALVDINTSGSSVVPIATDKMLALFNELLEVASDTLRSGVK